MKRTLLAASLSIMIVLFAASGWALENSFLDMRNKIFEESKEIKDLMVTPKDGVVVSTLWDTCLMTMSQLDAYFRMLAIFNTIPQDDLTKVATGELSGWLNEIKKTNEMNIKIISDATAPVDQETKIHMERLKSYYWELNRKIDTELATISTLSDLLKR